ncbi:MAG: N(2)-fixation sustaining protein CowN [Desulfuromonas sp.]|nr:MAG: N(2)-fixation sustaining protein CowN [Desulfuromonas sp.]
MNQTGQKSDRYVSFKGIEEEKNSTELIRMLRRHIDDPEKTNPFWEKYKQMLADCESGKSGKDYLFLIHSYINNLFEYFEEMEDEEALALLHKIEVECC